MSRSHERWFAIGIASKEMTSQVRGASTRDRPAFHNVESQRESKVVVLTISEKNVVLVQ